MRIIYKFCLIFFITFVGGCKTIENKSQSAIEQENEQLSKFLQQPESELKIEMGEPHEISYNDQGSKFLIYNKRKYNISCKRMFEIDKNKMVVGFTSKGCF